VLHGVEFSDLAGEYEWRRTTTEVHIIEGGMMMAGAGSGPMIFYHLQVLKLHGQHPFQKVQVVEQATVGHCSFKCPCTRPINKALMKKKICE